MKMLSKRKEVGSDVADKMEDKMESKMEGRLVKLRDGRMEETVSVAWNHFEETAVGAFKSLQEDAHFTDVTLACGDGQVLFILFQPVFNIFSGKGSQGRSWQLQQLFQANSHRQPSSPPPHLPCLRECERGGKTDEMTS